MKPTFAVALFSATVFASGGALACDDTKISGGDGYASKAPEAPAVVAEKATPITSTKQKAPAKQKTAGKPIPQGATLARTGN